MPNVVALDFRRTARNRPHMGEELLGVAKAVERLANIASQSDLSPQDRASVLKELAQVTSHLQNVATIMRDAAQAAQS